MLCNPNRSTCVHPDSLFTQALWRYTQSWFDLFSKLVFFFLFTFPIKVSRVWIGIRPLILNTTLQQMKNFGRKLVRIKGGQSGLHRCKLSALIKCMTILATCSSLPNAGIESSPLFVTRQMGQKLPVMLIGFSRSHTGFMEWKWRKERWNYQSEVSVFFVALRLFGFNQIHLHAVRHTFFIQMKSASRWLCAYMDCVFFWQAKCRSLCGDVTEIWCPRHHTSRSTQSNLLIYDLAIQSPCSEISLLSANQFTNVKTP